MDKRELNILETYYIRRGRIEIDRGTLSKLRRKYGCRTMESLNFHKIDPVKYWEDKKNEVSPKIK